MANVNVNGVRSFHEFQRRFRWKYGQRERERHREFPRVSKKISLKVWPTWTASGVSMSSTSFKENFVESMANVNVNGIGSFHEFQRRFRWKYGQHERERRREFPRVSKKISLKVWPTWTWTALGVSTSFKENFVESMANVNVNGVGSFHEFHEFQRKFRWKYGQRERERHREFPRVPRVSKKIALKVWPAWTWTASGVSTSFKEDFVESMANVNVNGIESFHAFHEFQRRFRWKYGQRKRSSTTFWEQRTAT